MGKEWILAGLARAEFRDVGAAGSGVFTPRESWTCAIWGRLECVPSPGGSSTGGEIRELPPAVLFTEYGIQSCIRSVHNRAPREVASCSLFGQLRGTYGRSKGSSGAAEILSTQMALPLHQQRLIQYIILSETDAPQQINSRGESLPGFQASTWVPLSSLLARPLMSIVRQTIICSTVANIRVESPPPILTLMLALSLSSPCQALLSCLVMTNNSNTSSVRGEQRTMTGGDLFPKGMEDPEAAGLNSVAILQQRQARLGRR